MKEKTGNLRVKGGRMKRLKASAEEWEKGCQAILLTDAEEARKEASNGSYAEEHSCSTVTGQVQLLVGIVVAFLDDLLLHEKSLEGDQGSHSNEKVAEDTAEDLREWMESVRASSEGTCKELKITVRV